MLETFHLVAALKNRYLLTMHIVNKLENQLKLTEWSHFKLYSKIFTLKFPKSLKRTGKSKNFRKLTCR